MTTQVAQIMASINQLTRKAKEDKEATINEAPLGAASTMEFQADHNHNEVVGELDQVCSELDIPIHVPEIQVDINAFDLLQLEPIKLVLDLDTAVWMSAHTHILDSTFSIDLMLFQSYEPVQVDFKFELPICLGEVQTSFDNLMHEKPLPDILAVIPDCTENLDEICVVEHIDISDDFYDVCIGLDNNFEDSFMDCVELTMDSVVITKEKPSQVLFNLEILVVLSEVPLQFSLFDCLCIDPLEPVVNTTVVIDSKVLRAPFEIERIHTPTVCIDNICPTFAALVLHENDLDFTFNKAEMFDDSLMNIDFDFAIVADMANIATHPKEAANTKEVVMDAREDWIWFGLEQLAETLGPDPSLGCFVAESIGQQGATIGPLRSKPWADNAAATFGLLGHSGTSSFWCSVPLGVFTPSLHLEAVAHTSQERVRREEEEESSTGAVLPGEDDRS
ncbi:hypothetical protein LR48_Vigan07g158200 [Vigna angularis]|uniref:Uncharacterized protein n=1 Tax=Phaseolus angularis TaxID=3914 RepID=A0A0L9UYL6_PHAAN|nr:hypothetical protein LR48_Vigan07g158200 [Vigna angularis]